MFGNLILGWTISSLVVCHYFCPFAILETNEKRKGIAYRDRYLYVRDMWHDANAGALALVCFDALWVVADAGGLWRGDAGAVEVAGLGFPAAWGYLLYAYARGSRGWFARCAVHGGTRGED